MSYGIVYTVDKEILLMTHTNGQFIGFSDAEEAAAHLATIASKNSEINGIMASFLFVSLLDFGLIEYPTRLKDMEKYLLDYKPESSEAKLHCNGVAGVKMHGLRVDKSISELKYEPKKPEPETPMSTSDNDNPYSNRN